MESVFPPKTWILAKRGLWSSMLISAMAAALACSFVLRSRADDEEEPAGEVVRTRAEVEAIIRAAGQSPPDWWDDVQMHYPHTLDLTWDDAQRGGNRNLNGFLWNHIRPNPRRWQEGAKLMHHTLTVNRNNPENMKRSMTELGLLFCKMEDWARAAYWWRRAGVIGGEEDPLGLARCYWKLGNREMATDILTKIETDASRWGNAITLLGEMGYTDRAIAVAERSARGNAPDIALLCAGNALRHAGRYE